MLALAHMRVERVNVVNVSRAYRCQLVNFQAVAWSRWHCLYMRVSVAELLELRARRVSVCWSERSKRLKKGHKHISFSIIPYQKVSFSLPFSAILRHFERARCHAIDHFMRFLDMEWTHYGHIMDIFSQNNVKKWARMGKNGQAIPADDHMLGKM